MVMDGNMLAESSARPIVWRGLGRTGAAGEIGGSASRKECAFAITATTRVAAIQTTFSLARILTIF
jgi:hypothetical protein